MDFTVAPNKDYRRDLEIISEALSRNETLSFSKFCDGEWAVMENQKINNKEFWFDPEDPDDAYKREKLIEAFQYQNDQYFVGISCAGVFGEDHSKMKKLCGQPAHRLTWADLWVNSNYSYYLDNVLPLFADRKIVLYCNSNSMTHNLPFTPEKVFPVSYNAWANDWDVIEESKKYIQDECPEGYTFLFCCGPFGNILCHELTEFNSNNTYLDVGSTLNPFLRSEGFQRDYYMGNNFFSNAVGVWDNATG